MIITNCESFTGYSDIKKIHCFRLQSEHCVTEISPDADANSCFIYVWEDWVAMVTNKHYSDLQTSLCPRKRCVCENAPLF